MPPQAPPRQLRGQVNLLSRRQVHKLTLLSMQFHEAVAHSREYGNEVADQLASLAIGLPYAVPARDFVKEAARAQQARKTRKRIASKKPQVLRGMGRDAHSEAVGSVSKVRKGKESHKRSLASTACEPSVDQLD